MSNSPFKKVPSHPHLFPAKFAGFLSPSSPVVKLKAGPEKLRTARTHVKTPLPRFMVARAPVKSIPVAFISGSYSQPQPDPFFIDAQVPTSSTVLRLALGHRASGTYLGPPKILIIIIIATAQKLAPISTMWRVASRCELDTAAGERE